MAEWAEQKQSSIVRLPYSGGLGLKVPHRFNSMITNSTPPCNPTTRPWAGLGPRGPWQSGEA
ncbi:unnamed protein product [Staurois parvus]|uniref:Uncharacterized protein n=1 Tax=Staurois parvus TaxID=386267 RepID=A0ABN9CP18_9NEOB|nr:unnamed protein product [Staurois parvus]